MKAIRRFSVRTTLPESLTGLRELAVNLRWSWHPETRALFESIDEDLWRSTGYDPVRLLGEVDPDRLEELAAGALARGVLEDAAERARLARLRGTGRRRAPAS